MKYPLIRMFFPTDVSNSVPPWRRHELPLQPSSPVSGTTGRLAGTGDRATGTFTAFEKSHSTWNQ